MNKLLQAILLISLSASASYAQYPSATALSAKSYEELDSLIMYYVEKEQYYLAVHFYEEMYRRDLGKPNSDSAKATNMYQLGSMHFEAGNYDKAEKYILEAKSLMVKNGMVDNTLYSSIISGIGFLYNSQQRYEEAELIYQEAISLREKQYGKNSPLYLNTLNNLGAVYWHLNRYKEAEDIFKTALEKSTEPERIVTYQQNLSAFYLKFKRYKEADSLHQETENIYKKYKFPKNMDYVQLLTKRAIVQYHLGNYSSSEAFIATATELLDQIFPMVSSERLNLLRAKANCLAIKGGIDTAITVLLSGLKINLSTSENQSNFNTISDLLKQDLAKKQFQYPLEVIDALELIADYCGQLYQKNKDIKWLENAIRLYEMQLAYFYNIQNDLAFDSEKFAIAELLIPSLAKAILVTNQVNELQKGQRKKRDALQFFESNKSIALTNALKDNGLKTFDALPDSILFQKKKLSAELDAYKKAEIEYIAVPEKHEKILSKINDLNQRIVALEERIKLEQPKYYAAKKNRTLILTIDSVQQLLKSDEAIVEYFIHEENLFVSFISKSSSDLFVLGISNEYQSRFKDFRESLSNYAEIAKNPEEAFMKFTKESYWLYQKTLEPVLKEQKKEIIHLIIIPDKELGHIPFEALLTEKADNTTSYNALPYLLKKYKVSYNYSTTLWRENQSSKENKSSAGILAMAASYGNKTAEAKTRSLRSPQLRNLRDALQDLPAARAEVDGLSKLFSGEFYYGEEANEAYFKKNAQNYAVIHLAMHGLLNTEYPILSSLAFTENGDSTEDNFLQAYEISHLNLTAQLVVLSACETGYGKFQQGEGVMSLARSFMYAGVPSLVVSMWQVNDQSTSLIMQAFYKNLAKGMDKAEALRQAKLTFIGSVDGIAAHPAFWAPFIQLGDTKPISIQTRGSGSIIWLWVVGTSILIVFAGLWLLLRKHKR